MTLVRLMLSRIHHPMKTLILGLRRKDDNDLMTGL